jgi:hypothetical protein
MKYCASSTISLRTLSVLIVVLVSSVFAAAQHEEVIYRFAGSQQDDGSLPDAGVVADAAGNLYGTTANGSFLGHGVVYELSPPVPPSKTWTETVLYRLLAAQTARARSQAWCSTASEIYMEPRGSVAATRVATVGVERSLSWHRRLYRAGHGVSRWHYEQRGQFRGRRTF